MNEPLVFNPNHAPTHTNLTRKCDLLRRLPNACQVATQITAILFSLWIVVAPAYPQESAYEVHWKNPVELKRRGSDDLAYDASYVCTAPDPKTGKRKARFQMGLGLIDSETRFKVYYPLCSKGDIIPIFGTACVVGYVPANSYEKDSGIDENGPNPGRVKLAGIRGNDRDVVVAPNCLTIANRGTVERYDMTWDRTWTKAMYTLDVESIFERDDVPVVRVNLRVVNFRGVKRQSELSEPSVVELKIGERFQVPASYRVFDNEKELLRDKELYLVKHIVLPDAEKQIVGWVSFESLLQKWPRPLKAGETQ